MVVIESDQEIEDFVRGCTFLGTGGGGEPAVGIAWLKAVRDKGEIIGWVDHTEISDDVWTACPFVMGSIAPLTEEVSKRKEWFGLTEELYRMQHEAAVRWLEEYMSIKIGALVAIEPGGGNTPGVVAAASLLGISAVDGDYAGRAMPEIFMTTPCLNKLSLCPIASIDSYGNFAVIKESTSYQMAERIGKLISAASFGFAGQAGFPLKGRDMKRVVIPGTLSKCLRIGRSIRQAREGGVDPVRAIIKEFDGWLLFEGAVSKKEWEDKEGYYWGSHTIRGQGEFEGSEFRIWFKNENHVSWLDGKPYVTSPDMLIVLERQNGEPITNASLTEGQHVAVVGLRAVEPFRTPEGVNVLGPRHFQFDIDHTPIDKVVSQKGKD